jgi:hypothetical protein
MQDALALPRSQSLILLLHSLRILHPNPHYQILGDQSSSVAFRLIQ